MQIEKIKFLSDYCIELYLTNEKTIIYDLKPLLHTARFQRIKSQAYFESGKLLENKYIQWDKVTELQDYEMLGVAFTISDYEEDKSFKGTEE